VALVTDYGFGSDAAVGYSILVVCATSQLLGALLLRSGYAAYRNSYRMQRAEEAAAA